MKKKLVHISLLVFLVAFILFVIWYAINAYLIVSINTGVERDGLGRMIYISPRLLQSAGILTWPGSFWFVIDSLIGWSGLAALIGSLKIATKLKSDE